MTIAVLLLLAVKSLLVAAVTLALLRLTRKRSAAERSTIAHVGLFALVALPLASLALPTLTVTLPAPVARVTVLDSPSLLAPSGGVSKSAITSSAAPIETPSAILVTTVARYAYLVPALMLLALTLAALFRLVGLRARAEVLIDTVWLSALARAQRRMGFKNGTALLASNELGSPVSWGLMRPVILLNDAAVLAPEQAEAIIAHELAHVVHFDWAKLILARVATAAFWFNPLAWVLAREAHQLREEAADDAVLAANIAGPDYAELLIGVARHQCRGALLGAHGVAPSKSSLGRRVRRVLDQSPARGPSARSWVAGFAAGMLSMAVPLAAVTFVSSRTALAIVSPSDAGQPSANTLPRTTSGDADVSGTIGSLSPLRPGPTGNTPTSAQSSVSPLSGAPDQNQSAAASRNLGDSADPDEQGALGALDQYQRAMAQAGFPNLSTDQLAGARAVGVTPQYARDMRATGMRLSLEDVVEARAMGLSPSYVAAMRGFGINGDLDDYQGMRAVGVTASFVSKLRARGINTTSPDELTSLRAAGASQDP